MRLHRTVTKGVSFYFLKVSTVFLLHFFALQAVRRLGAEGSIVSHQQVMKDQRSLLKGNPVG
jgi:hypothetical protein